METTANTVPTVTVKVIKANFTLPSIINAAKIIALEFNMNLQIVPEVWGAEITFKPTSLDGDSKVEALNARIEEIFGNEIANKKEA